MTKENKYIFSVIALGTLLIGSALSLIIYFIFGERAAFFFVVVFAIPIGAIFSLLFMMLYRAVKPNK